MKGAFFTSTLFSESCLDHLTIFSLMKLESKFELKIYVYWWSTDLVIVCFFAPLLSQIIDGDSLVTFVAISQWIPL